MSIAEELSRQMREALKEGRKERLRALRLLRAELQVGETSGGDFDEVATVKSYANKLRKTVEEYERLGLGEKAAEVGRELQVVEEFLPRQMSQEELETLIAGLIEEHDWGPRDVGRVMKAVMTEHGDVVDGRMAQQVARQKLAEQG